MNIECAADVRHLLKKKHSSIGKAADAYGYKEVTIYHHINGRCHNPTIGKLIAKDLKLSLADCWSAIYPDRYQAP